jgi:hypothetical protein
MMNEKVFGSKRSWFNWCGILVFVWRQRTTKKWLACLSRFERSTSGIQA